VGGGATGRAVGSGGGDGIDKTASGDVTRTAGACVPRVERYRTKNENPAKPTAIAATAATRPPVVAGGRKSRATRDMRDGAAMSGVGVETGTDVMSVDRPMGAVPMIAKGSSPPSAARRARRISRAFSNLALRSLLSARMQMASRRACTFVCVEGAGGGSEMCRSTTPSGVSAMKGSLPTKSW
jgi:hypothetical protein